MRLMDIVRKRWFLGGLAMVMAVCVGERTYGEEYDFPMPSDDRWHYPFNFTAGARPIATCFSSVGNITFPSFNDRDGLLVVAWDTSELIEPGFCPERYVISAMRVTLTNTSEAEWPEDLTPDEWFTFDFNNDGEINGDGIPRGMPGDVDGESDDLDFGRTLELFGAGFGPKLSYQSWNENSFYVGADQFVNNARDPFPFSFQEETGAKLHVEDSVKGTQNESAEPPVFQFTPKPWAVGLPINYTPGDQPVPFDVIFDIHLDESDGLVRRYFQEQLSGGRVIVVVTSLIETVMFGQGGGELPAFFNKEGLSVEVGAKAPRLTLVLSESQWGDYDLDCDVDLDDYRAMAGCLSGQGIVPNPLPPLSEESCLRSFDFYGDSDVDEGDVAIFSRIFTGGP